MKTPLVSIIIPVYNGKDFMREAIDSALAQTYKNIEVIVINDGSIDNGETDLIARSYGNKIKYYSQYNGGVSSALNTGIREMSGDYFSWLSHDDVYEPDKIEKQVNALNLVDERTIICSNHILVNQDMKPISGYKPKQNFIPNTVYNSCDVLKGLLKKSTFNGCCLLIPREALIISGLFDESLRFCQDAVMWYNIFLNGYSLYCISDNLVKNRIHSNQLTQKRQDLFVKECGEISNSLMHKFANISSLKNNYLEMYLLSDAKYFETKTLKKIICFGQKRNLISTYTIIKAYLLHFYGQIRPYIRKAYYHLFRKIRFT